MNETAGTTAEQEVIGTPPPPAVLLLEDCGEVRVIVEAMLRRRGVSCHSAASLAEARTLLARHRYDILVLDVNLPDGRGLSVLTPGPDAPLAVVMTGDDSETTSREAVRAGAADVIAKPFGVSEFLRHFDAVIEKWRIRWNGRLQLSSAVSALEPVLQG
jgi:DNA-binding response OmpR family regulator